MPRAGVYVGQFRVAASLSSLLANTKGREILMRKHQIDMVLHSDIDLTALSSKRVTITRREDGSFHVASSLRFFRCERVNFVSRYLRRMKPGMVAVTGNCSAPTGYFWSRQALTTAY